MTVAAYQQCSHADIHHSLVLCFKWMHSSLVSCERQIDFKYNPFAKNKFRLRACRERKGARFKYPMQPACTHHHTPYPTLSAWMYSARLSPAIPHAEQQTIAPLDWMHAVNIVEAGIKDDQSARLRSHKGRCATATSTGGRISKDEIAAAEIDVLLREVEQRGDVVLEIVGLVAVPIRVVVLCAADAATRGRRGRAEPRYNASGLVELRRHRFAAEVLHCPHHALVHLQLERIHECNCGVPQYRLDSIIHCRNFALAGCREGVLQLALSEHGRKAQALLGRNGVIEDDTKGIGAVVRSSNHSD